MTSIQITLQDNTVYDVELESYNVTEMTNMLNDQKLLVVNIGGIIVNRGAIKSIVKIGSEII